MRMRFSPVTAYPRALHMRRIWRFLPSFKITVNHPVALGGYITQPCAVQAMWQQDDYRYFKRSKNRQIRRMCKALGYAVTGLKRIRMADNYLGDLKPVN